MAANSQLEVHTVVVTPFAQNARILQVQGTREAVVLDPGGDVPDILDRLSKLNLDCSAIWLTHSHLDHCGGVAALQRACGAPLIGPRLESEMRAHVLEICTMYGLSRGDMENCPEPNQKLDGGEEISLAGVSFKVLFTPGHSPGHVCFYSAAAGVLLAGDTLFAGSIGRTDLPGGDHQTLLESIRTQLMSLPDAVRVLPGHGPETTIGRERSSNPFVSGRM